MTAPFRQWCAEKRDEAHRLAIVRMAREQPDDAGCNEVLELSTLDHQVRQAVAFFARPNSLVAVETGGCAPPVYVSAESDA